MHGTHLFQLGDKLLLVTIERQSILIDGEIAGFVETLFDREERKTEARIWLYPNYRSFTTPVRRWIERTQGADFVLHDEMPGTAAVRWEAPATGSDASERGASEAEWRVGFRADRQHGYEVFLTDRLTGFLYPVHTSRSRRDAFGIKQEIDADLLILSSDAFAEKWGLQRIRTDASGKKAGRG